MDVKTSVRERRQSRIRAIQSRMESGYNTSSQAWLGSEPEPFQPAEPPSAIRSNELYGQRSDDPEYAWNNRERMLMSQWRSDDSGGGGWRIGPSRRLLWMKLILSVIIYGLIIGLFQLQSGWAAEAKRFVRAALTQDTQVEAVAAWYEKTFTGAPSFIPAFLTRNKPAADKAIARTTKSFHSPVKGIILTGFNGGHPFVELKAKADLPIVSIDAGLIVLAGMQEGIGYSITIQHAGGFQSTYSGLRPGKWEKDDWVNAGDTIGTAAPGDDGSGIIRFAILKDREYINPVDVVSFD